jgi:hypothetical protein
MTVSVSPLAHVPAKWNPVRQGEPLFADKDMRNTGIYSVSRSYGITE